MHPFSGLIQSDAVVEFGAWLDGPRVRPRGLVIFDSTGVAVQDAKIAELALEQASAPARSDSKL